MGRSIAKVPGADRVVRDFWVTRGLARSSVRQRVASRLDGHQAAQASHAGEKRALRAALSYPRGNEGTP